MDEYMIDEQEILLLIETRWTLLVIFVKILLCFQKCNRIIWEEEEVTVIRVWVWLVCDVFKSGLFLFLNGTFELITTVNHKKTEFQEISKISI